MAELYFDETMPDDSDPKVKWYRLLTRYHWFVLTVAALGWLFDCLDQQLFNLARKPAITELLGTTPLKADIDFYSGLSTSVFLMGWATGGIIFGVMGDRYGRAKTMMLTILMYSVCTGLSALSTGVWDFMAYRFLTGLGVGGEFAVGVALVAEVMPNRARPFALGLLQALSAVGNISAALISIGLSQFEDTGISAWRIMFVIGALPALLSLFIRRRLHEPAQWKALSVAHKAGGAKLGSFKELFGDPRWRKRALVGLAMASAGVIGLWGIAFFSFDLFRSVFEVKFKAEGFSGPELNEKLAFWTGITSVMQNIGGFFGIYAFSRITHYSGRIPAFAVAFTAAMLSTMMVFWYFDDLSHIFWMIPIMGFCQLAVFGGYAIYFPELFPTRLRSTGTSFCYNVGRFVAAIGPFTFGYLSSSVFTAANGYEREPMRYAGVVMSSIFVVGLLALPFAPETGGKPLPE